MKLAQVWMFKGGELTQTLNGSIFKVVKLSNKEIINNYVYVITLCN